MNNIDLYNYISGRPKFLYLANFSFFLAIVILLYFYKDVFSDQNIAFYTFSTIVEGFLALVGFLGAITIFKIQLIENEAQKISDGLEIIVLQYKGVVASSFSWIEMMNACSNILDDKNSNYHIDEIKSGFEKLCRLRDEKSPIRNTMVDFSLITLVNVMVALIGILFSKILISNGLFLANAIYTLITLCLAFYSVKMAFKVIRFGMGYSFVRKVSA